MIRSIPVDQIRADASLQPRDHIDADTLHEYVDALIDGVRFPPVVLFAGPDGNLLADGFHRYYAAIRTRTKDLLADVREGTRRDAILHACGANADHGLRRTAADKRRAVTTMLLDEEWRMWSSREIARACRVSHTLVDEVRSESTGSVASRKGRDGRTIDTTNIGRRPESPPDEDEPPEPDDVFNGGPDEEEEPNDEVEADDPKEDDDADDEAAPLNVDPDLPRGREKPHTTVAQCAGTDDCRTCPDVGICKVGLTIYGGKLPPERAERRPLDAYYTPDDLAEALVATLPRDALAGAVVEPHAGGGAFVRALRQLGASVLAVDIDPDAKGLAEADVQVVGNFLTWSAPDLRTIIGNPPYSEAEAHVRHALELVEPGGYVAFLLQLSFLAASERVPFWAESPAWRVTVLAERPSFTGDPKTGIGKTNGQEYAWFVWRKGEKGKALLDVLSWRPS